MEAVADDGRDSDGWVASMALADSIRSYRTGRLDRVFAGDLHLY